MYKDGQPCHEIFILVPVCLYCCFGFVLDIYLWGYKVKNLNCFCFFPQVETTQADLRPEQQAKQQVTVQPFVTFNQRNKNYLYISTGTNRVSVGDNLSLKLSITVADQADKEHIKQITYLVRQEHHITF